MTERITEQQVKDWVAGYVAAWRSGKRADIEALFATDAESYEWPYETAWVGRKAIVDGWRERAPWQEGGWSFEWRLPAPAATLRGPGHRGHRGTEQGAIGDLWVATLGGDGRAARFRTWNSEV